MKATEFDREFDAGEDVSGHVDWSKGKRPNEQIKRVNVDFPTRVVAGLDRQARIKLDPTFREELHKEGVECLLSGEVDTGKAVLRDYINATIGFQELGGLTAKSPKSLMRMFGPNGNPQARNLFEIIGHLQKREGLYLKIETVRSGS